MGLTTLGVGAAVSPALMKSWITHFTNRKEKHQKPTAHLSYDVGLSIVRQFLLTASHDTVESIQSFTAQFIPTPSWVRKEVVNIPQEIIFKAVDRLQDQLGAEGLEQVGGRLWWQWRRDDQPLKAEWIEMKKDYEARLKKGGTCQRSMMYIHGGAYFFGSPDEHRYQIQRHARKLQARALVPRYRLAPQYPFPCGLLDCLAAYLWLLTQQPPETIVLAGDSAGGGMVLSLLVICRDQGIPLPAGAVLISPWVDLTHSFPSLSESAAFDYVPPAGFHHKPSPAWPPPNSDDMKVLDEILVPGPDGVKIKRKDYMKELFETAQKGREFDKQKARELGYNETFQRNLENSEDQSSSVPGEAEELTIEIDGKIIALKDQIQMYAPNALLTHPLVSPALQPSLGGLPPLMIVTGGGELLRDEQIYIAHKAANPAAYPSPERGEGSAEKIAAAVQRHRPTLVQLQVWDDMCHVATTLSFTRPAKYMYRSIAQFGAWALARSQRAEIRILADDEISEISDDSEDDEEEMPKDPEARAEKILEQKTRRTSHYINPDQTPSAVSLSKSIGKAGDPLPPFHKSMIRQRVTRHGEIFPLAPASKLPALQMPRESIGVIKAGPVSKWLDAQKWYAHKFGKEKRKIQEQRIKEIEAGGVAVFVEDGADLTSNILERPPPTAMAGRRKVDLPKKVVEKHGSKGLAMWAKYGANHDENAIEKEESKIARKQKVSMSVTSARPKGSANSKAANSVSNADYTMSGGAGGAPQVPEIPITKKLSLPGEEATTGQSADAIGIAVSDHALTALPQRDTGSAPQSSGNDAVASSSGTAVVPALAAEQTEASGHPTIAEDGAVSPFKVASAPGEQNPSTMTLTSQPGVVPPIDQVVGDTNGTQPSSAAPSVQEEEPVIETAQARRVSGPVTATETVTPRTRSSWSQGMLNMLPVIGSKHNDGASVAASDSVPEVAEEPKVDGTTTTNGTGGPLTGNVDNHQHNQFGGNVRDGTIGHDALAPVGLQAASEAHKRDAITTESHSEEQQAPSTESSKPPADTPVTNGSTEDEVSPLEALVTDRHNALGGHDDMLSPDQAMHADAHA